MATAEQSWELATRWARDPKQVNLSALRPLTTMALVPLSLLVYARDLALVSRIALTLAVVVGAYLFISTMLYLPMRSAAQPPPRTVPESEAEGLLAKCHQFGSGLGISESDWTALKGQGWSVHAPMPDSPTASVVSIETSDASAESDAALMISFAGRQSEGRLLLSTHLVFIFPMKRADVLFDADASIEELWTSHRERLAKDGPGLTTAEFVALQSSDDLTNAGFIPFVLHWGRYVWKRQGFLRART